MEIVGFIVIEITIVLILAFLYSYIKKKAENLATKEDVSEITRDVEAVKHEYSSKLESVKTVLCARLFTQQVRYQNEFDMLLSLSEKLTEFKRALDNFEFLVLSDRKNQANDIHINQAAKEALAAMGPLLREYEAHKPFYPKDIYESVSKFHSLAFTKLFLKGYEENVIESSTFSKTFVDFLKEKNQNSDAEDISEVVEKIYAAIRRRVQYWEELHIE